MSRGRASILRDVGTDFAYYDREADIAWLRTGVADTVVSEELDWGLIDHDRVTDEVVGIEIWSASTLLPPELLDRLPTPVGESGGDS
jgi:uncharacterized protein YuzE